MVLYHQTRSRNKFLFVNSFSPQQHAALKKIGKLIGTALVPVLLFDRKKIVAPWVAELKDVILIQVDIDDTTAIQTALKPYEDEIVGATTLGDGNVPHLRRVIPLVPYCNLPTEKSLDWSTEKIKMRALLRNYDKDIAPKFIVAGDATAETIERIEKKVGYPLVVKPSGLAASLLVSICYHREELEKVLKTTLRKMDQVYKAKRGRGVPKMLIEEFMEGDMYSIDAYVNARGVIYFAPAVYVTTGRSVGFDDFFGYMRMTPTQLNPAHTDEAQEAASKGIKALGMRSTTCHIELMRTENGWKVIEMGPRMGGFRHEMYDLSFGIDHSLNDILIRLPKQPILPKKVKGYTAVMQFYAQKEGRLEKLQGLFKIEALESVMRVKVRKEIGDRCTFAKNGGDPVLEVILFNQTRPNLLADVRRLEQSLVITTSQKATIEPKPANA
jgi:biotin carboxylase